VITASLSRNAAQKVAPPPVMLRCRRPFLAQSGSSLRCRKMSAIGCRATVAQSCQVHREAFEIGERAVSQRSLMSSAQDYAGRLARLECFLPAGGTQAPPVTWLQAWKAEFRHWCRKIVAARFGKIHHGADGMASSPPSRCDAGQCRGSANINRPAAVAARCRPTPTRPIKRRPQPPDVGARPDDDRRFEAIIRRRVCL
jgi:hypothetical protein